MMLSTVENIVIQAIGSHNHCPDFEEILTTIFKIRQRSMDVPVLESALRGLWRQGIVTNDIDACIKRYRLTEKGKTWLKPTI